MADLHVALPPGRISEQTLSSLLEASAALNSSLDLRTTLQAIARSAADVLDAEASSVLLLDRRRGKLVFAAAHGSSGDMMLGLELDADQGIAGRVARTGKPLRVPDVRQHPDFYKKFDDQSTFVTRGLLAAPLHFRGAVLGVVEVLNKRGEGDFSDQDLEILKVFANLAAISASNAQTHDWLKRENRGLRAGARRDGSIIGRSAALDGAIRLCERVAQTNTSVLLLGETGTGKELTARWIHARSPRANKPFIAINCAALPETLLESELFGHEAGAFTGASDQKLGRFELADGGTLFLDEIGDISLSTQVKLLRVLQEREFVRVGGTKTIACDVRIIAATNRDLKAGMETGAFREDLFYRLNVFPIRLPPLRERREDIPLLLEYFMTETARELTKSRPTLDPEAARLLCAYDWPGNIREMRNVLERAVLLCDAGVVGPEQLPREIVAAGGELQPVGRDGPGSALASHEKAMIVKALQENGWNQTRAAAALNISRDNLRYRVRKYAIRKP
jgi:Nif-specific regulatory protein